MTKLYVCKQYDTPYERVCAIITPLEEHDKQIRADAIEECIKLQLDMSCVENCIHMMDCTECMAKQMEELKEQK